MFLEEISDDLLICLYREKNQIAIDLLFERYSRFLYGIINDVATRNNIGLDYEELFHDAMIVFMKCIERYDEEAGCFYFFVRKSVERKISDIVKKAKRDAALVSSIDVYKFESGNEMVVDYIAEPGVETNELYELLSDRLKEVEKRVLDLKLSGYSYDEIGDILNITKQKVYRKMSVIKNILKDIIEKID